MASEGSRSRYYEPADLKKLFALSRNQCAFPSCEERLADERWPQVMAEIAHIYGLNKHSARHLPGMTAKECNEYENLILLCPNHHHRIDNLERDEYTPDVLLEIKHRHETRQGGPWIIDDAMLDEAVRKLAATEAIILSTDRTIRSRPDLPEPEAPRRDSNRKVKLRDLAVELGMAEDLIMQLSNDLGVGAKTINSTIIPQQADRIRRRFERNQASMPAGVSGGGIGTVVIGGDAIES